MADIIWRDRAIRHLEAVGEYLQAHSPLAAERYVSDLRVAVASLTDFPEKGRRFDGKRRVLVLRNHLILYIFDPRTNRIFIADVIDGRRDIPSLIRYLSD